MIGSQQHSQSRHVIALMAARSGCKISTYTLVGGLAQAAVIENVGNRLVMVKEWDSRTHYLEPGENVEVVYTPELRVEALNNGLSKE